MALDAVRAHAMIQHLLPHRRLFGVAGGVRRARRQRRHVRRRIRRTHAEDVPHDPLAAGHRRGPFGLRGGDQKRALAQQPAAQIQVGAERDAAELASVDVRDPVVPGQPLVDEGVVRVEQIGNASVLADDAVEQQLDFAPHGLAQRVVEVGIQQRQRADALQAPQVQPLAREVDRQRLRPRILEHAANLALENDGILEPPLTGDGDQLIVGDGAPEEEGQPRREVEVAEAIRLAGLRRRPAPPRSGR